MTVHTSGTGAIQSWDEEPYIEIDESRKLTRASVRYKYSGDWQGESISESLMCYANDGTASFVGLERFVGRIGDHEGSFVIQETGFYDGTEARSEGHVVPGSGTGDFERLRGRHVSVSTHEDYPNRPFEFDYEI